jgi:hypothetical protein
LVSYHPNIEAIREKQRINTTERWNNMTEQEKIEYGEKMKRDRNPNWRGGKTFMECPICGKEYRSSTKRNTCNACRNRTGEFNPFYNKTHTNETKEKFRQNMLGKTMAEETKLKCQQASIDFYNSEKGKIQKELQSLKMKGKNHFLYGIGHTNESKNKMSYTKKEKFKNMTIEEMMKQVTNKDISHFGEESIKKIGIEKHKKLAEKMENKLYYRNQFTGDYIEIIPEKKKIKSEWGIQLPKFKDGGIIATGPTKVLIAEAGNPELIVPINDEGLKFINESMSTVLKEESYVDKKETKKEEKDNYIVQRIKGYTPKYDKKMFDIKNISHGIIGVSR